MSLYNCIYFATVISFATNIGHAKLENRLEDGLAITHPRIVRTLEQRLSGEGIGLGYYFNPNGPAKISNKGLSELPNFQKIVSVLDKELELFKDSKKGDKHDTAGVGLNFHNRMFDSRFLKDDRAVFSLVGVINRVDQAYKDPDSCGETRLIYRLAYRVSINPGEQEKSVASRLPMTINLVLNSRPKNSSLSCADIAKRWQSFDIEGMTVSSAVDKIMADGGPLSKELRDRSLIKSLEINLQLSRKAAAVRPDFGGHAVYLLKVFKWDLAKQTFVESTLDNQVSREKAKEFYKWLFDSNSKQQRLSLLDKGLIQIPEKYLTTRAYSIAPGGMARAQNHPLEKIVSDDELSKQLKDTDMSQFLNIKSLSGFKRRISDISCTGCHQTRAIGGFHFMGQDPSRWIDGEERFKAVYPGNAVVVPGSGHFFSDLTRRRIILDAVAEGRAPNYETGFSSRPQENTVQLADGLGIYNGWGAHCYVGNDPSFKSWTCSAGTRCLELHESEVAQGMGVCISASHKEIGDPTERGKISSRGKTWYGDSYKRSETYKLPGNDSDYVNSPQSAQAGSKTGGFPGGSIRTSSCGDKIMSRHPEAKCGALPAASSGFNNCLFDKSTTFEECVDKYSKGVGLRGCSRENPCRDDYICAESFEDGEDIGVCVPPYFLFQFRVDGHPIKF